MKKLYIPFFLALAAVTAQGVSAETITHEVEIDLSDIEGKIEEVDGVQYLRYGQKGLDLTGEPGYPELPVKYVRLAVPTRASNFTVSAQGTLHGESDMFGLKVYPAQTPVTTNESEDDREFTQPDATFYARNEYNSIAEYCGEGFLGGDYHIITLAVYPVSYNPAQGKSRIYSDITLSVTYDDNVPLAQMPMQPITPTIRPTYFDYTTFVDNAGKPGTYPARAAGADDLQVEIPKRYYIVTARNLVPAFDRLATWKRQKGYTVVVKAIEDILPLFPNGDVLSGLNDDAGKLRAYLTSEFQKYGSFFLLIGGDYTNTPVRNIYLEPNTTTKPDPFIQCNVVSDHYFSDINTEWECNIEGLISAVDETIDFFPEIFVGRIQCRISNEVLDYTDKLIFYESNPGKGDSEYLNRCFSFVEKSNIMDFNKIEDCNMLYKVFPGNHTIYKDANASVLLGNSEKDIFPAGKHVITELNQTGFGMVNFYGHGHPSGISTGNWTYYWSNSTKTSTVSFGIWSDSQSTSWLSDKKYSNFNSGFGLDNLTNHFHPFVAYSIACTTSPSDQFIDGYNYTGVVFSRSITLRKNIGAVAFLGNSRYGLGNKRSSSLHYSFLEMLLTTQKIGISEALSKVNYRNNEINSKYIKLVHHLIGEPEFEIWTAKPFTLKNLSLLVQGKSVLALGEELENAKISIFDGENNSIMFKCNKSWFTRTEDIINPAISVWKTGFLPIITWNPSSQTINNCIKTFLVNTVSLGKAAVSSEEEYYDIGNGATVNLEVLQSVNCNAGLKVSGGTLNIKTPVTVNIEGSKVESGGVMKIESPSVILDKDFEVEKGGILIIEN